MNSESDLLKQFEEAIIKANSMPTQTSDAMLRCYAYFKQAKFGDSDEYMPQGLNMIEVFKFKSWQTLIGMKKEEAMQKYIEYIDFLIKEGIK